MEPIRIGSLYVLTPLSGGSWVNNQPINQLIGNLRIGVLHANQTFTVLSVGKPDWSGYVECHVAIPGGWVGWICFDPMFLERKL